DFSGTNETENNCLMAMLEKLGKEVYVAVFDQLSDDQLSEEQLGASVCRILVPDYSEVYPVEDLIWDNTNKALDYREDILNLHSLDNDALLALVDRLEESQLDNYIDIRTLIGVEFDENTVWGQLTILELKILIYLALGELENAIELVGEFLQYNDNTVERGLFYQAVHTVLEITLDKTMVLEDFSDNLIKMFTQEVMTNVVGSITGEVNFFGLTATSMQLEGLDKHLRLIESYKKLHQARKLAAGN
ncbi:MAG: OsmC domain/YcaO domain-containing protein, partial [Alteromonadaceae bacterium]|nr:OsmC domain/YcaO domain-containing protein [Alteromonadaceae bacterium]